MGDAIGSMLASAVGIAISPLPLTAVIMMLATPRGRTNGVAFTVGRLFALAVFTTGAVLVGSRLDTGGPRPVWYWWFRLVVGVLLLCLGARQWHERPREGHVHRPPEWMRVIDRMTPGRSAELAAVLVSADPRTLLLAIGGGVSIATSTASVGGRTVATVLLVLIGSLCTLLPVGIHALEGEKSVRMLGEWKAWLSTHNAAITATLMIVLGATYVGGAITGLTTPIA